MWLIVLLGAAILFIIVATAWLKMHPFLALLFSAFAFGILSGMPLMEVIDSINAGFGGTIGYIGIVILFGAIIGAFLEHSGGATRLAEAIQARMGRRNVPGTMSIMGFVVSIPVFCDSGFVILSSLNRAMCKRAGISLGAGAIALSLGLYATHVMVPPTPGPIAAAGILEADLGLVILWGLLVAIIACFAGWLFAITIGRWTWIDPAAAGPGSAGGAEAAVGQATSLDEGKHPVVAPEGAPEAGATDTGSGPSATRALLPIVVPIVLIVLRSLVDLPMKPIGEGLAYEVIAFLGQPVVALLIGLIIAMTLPRKLTRDMISSSGFVGKAVVAAATIIVITGAGGAFGKVLQNSGIADAVSGRITEWDLGILLPFVVAAGIKTAQGSSTVAIITTAGLMAPLLGTLGLDGATAKALVVVAIGAGSMVVSHANDSFFWVVTQFSGMTAPVGYRLQTLGTLWQGAVAAGCVWVIATYLV